MAVYAAHLTRTLGGTPSVFEVTAQEALGATVKPALRKVVEYLAAVYPHKCGWCVPWFDELYLLFDCCLQYHYLKHYAASFSESFYGLLRVPISVSSEFASGQRLPDLLEKGSLVCLVFIPYLKDKIEKIVERWREDDLDGQLGKSPLDRVRRAAVRVYCVAHLAWGAARLLQLARYTRGVAEAHAPALSALGLALRPAPPQDDEEDSWTDVARALLAGQFGGAALSFPLMGRAVLRAAEYGAFAVHFLRWWEARAAAPPSAPPPPPPKDEMAERWKNRCPLCLQKWRIPTVLPVSGFVFCYACIARHVRAAGCCPVSRAAAATGDLVRLYAD